MDRESCLALVRLLTEQVVSTAVPKKLADFAADFANFALNAGVLQVSEGPAPYHLQSRGLETTLVAGMFFEALMAASHLPAGPGERVAFVRQKAKSYLVNRLAGQITLSQLYRLLSLIEEHVQLYFTGLQDDWAGRGAAPETLRAVQPGPVAAAVQEEELRQALARLPLPLKGRKLSSQGIWLFLRDTSGRWFRLLDLEDHFQVNKKTAWNCLNLLLKGDILEHNGEKANRVRYALAAPFRRPAPAPPGPA